MFPFSGLRSKRRAGRVSSLGEVQVLRSRASNGGGEEEVGSRLLVGGRRVFITLLLHCLLHLITEVASAESVGCQMRRVLRTALARVTRVSERRLLFVIVTSSTPSPPFTGMLMTSACFPPSITSHPPYLLTSLHVTTSTAIRAVDDNQSCN